jgi:hypothetical protein
MSHGNDSASSQDSARRAQRIDRASVKTEALGSGNDPLCSEEIDAQIRWFFENALQPTPPRP